MSRTTVASTVPTFQEIPLCVRSAAPGSFRWLRVGTAIRTGTGLAVRFAPTWEAVARVLWDARGGAGDRPAARSEGVVWGLRLPHGAIVTVGLTAARASVLRALPAPSHAVRRSAGMSIGQEGPRPVRAWRPAA